MESPGKQKGGGCLLEALPADGATVAPFGQCVAAVAP